MAADPVRAQYEDYPYPPRDPKDEARRLVSGSPSHIDEVVHYIFGGAGDLPRPFRVLVAGGGTGDATVMLAQHLADRGIDAEVVYVDLSEASRTIAEARVRARGLTNVRFETMSLLDLPESGLGPFDYIDCCGVLHHLADPGAGLAALVRVLGDGGGLGVMLYGEFGRTGVYPMQQMVRMLNPDGPAPERLDTARRLLRGLPETNWLKRNPFIRDHVEQGDAGLFDLLLHARDRAYRVPEIAELCEEAGLRITAFVEPALYDPATYIADPRLSTRLVSLPWMERCTFAELIAGNLRTHIFYAVRATNPVALPDPEDPTVVPLLRDGDGTALAGMEPGSTVKATVSGVTIRRPLPPLAAAMIKRIDGCRTLAEIQADMAATNPHLDGEAFRRQFVELYQALNGLGWLHLTRAG